MDNKIIVAYVDGINILEYTFYTETDEYTVKSEVGHHGTLTPLDKMEVPEAVLSVFSQLQVAEFSV